MANLSPLQKLRYEYQPKLPTVLKGNVNSITVKLGSPTESIADQAEVKGLFTKTYGLPVAEFVEGSNENAGEKINVGVILSGGQAPGGHNVIAGIYDGVKNGNKDSKVFGFLRGPAGIMKGELIEITPEFMNEYRNTGGFDMIGSGRDKLESEEHFKMAQATCEKHGITSVVIIGGDDSNTNGAVLAEYFAVNNTGITVVGCPKTIDGDLKNEHIETSFGFDTACKTYSELIGNIQRDANSAKKYWHFIKLMGRSASHIGLECALETQPNICIISEEVEADKKTLNSVVEDIVNVIVKRSSNGDNFGVALIPEGLIEFIPEMKVLISELNTLLAIEADAYGKVEGFDAQVAWIVSKVTKEAGDVFSSLPTGIQAQLLMDRDPHGNVQVSRIETEKLLIEMVDKRLNQLKADGKFIGSFSGLNHFFGYEGRCAFPSNFDADYCYSLGYTAFLLINQKLTGYISNVKNLEKSATDWVAGGVPLTMMMNMEQRHGHMKPVIKKALVELDGAPFKAFKAVRDEWALKTMYLYPGAIQYYGPSEVCDLTTRTLAYEKV